jgi:hypothetical protein
MKRSTAGALILLTLAFLLGGCGGGGGGHRQVGSLAVRVEFPPKGSEASRLIPSVAASVSVDVTRDGSPLVPRAIIPNPGGGPASTTITNIPTGAATVTCRAWTTADPAQGQVLAAGTADIAIVEGENTVEVELMVALFGTVIDATTREPIQGALVTVSESVAGTATKAAGALVGTATTDADGNYSVPIGDGMYRVDCTMDGYDPGVAEPVQPDPDWGSRRVDFALVPTGSGELIGGIAGRVTDEDLQPIPGAIVQIGSPETNGVFASTTVADDGTYSITGFSLLDYGGNPIPDFDVLAFASGYVPQTRVVTIPANTTLTGVDFVLVAGEGGTPIPQCDEANDWTMTGLWNARPDTPKVINQFIPGILIPEGYVILGPDDTSGGALPDAYTPSCAFWYGGYNYGNYVGDWDEGGAEPLDGGRSVAENLGDLISPPIVLPGISADALARGNMRGRQPMTVTLLFTTWFEIESVDPSAFDLMTIAVSNDDGANYDDLGILNPAVDPVISQPEVPYGSAGSLKEPVWTLYSLDLSDYQGQSVRLRFRFDTQDNLYNGFRGWVIDDARILAQPQVTAGKGPAGATPVRLLKRGELARLHARKR